MQRNLQTPLLLLSLFGGMVGGGCATTAFADGSTTIGVKRPPAPTPPPAAPTPEPPKRVRVNGQRIQITEKIQFDLDKATIKPASDSLLSEIADVIKANPQLKKIRVEGHASKDKPGMEKYDQNLSEERAKAVLDALVAKGVKQDTLIAQGFGQTAPIASNDTEAGREQNRRVDFVIVDPPAPQAGAAAGGAK